VNSCIFTHKELNLTGVLNICDFFGGYLNDEDFEINVDCPVPYSLCVYASCVCMCALYVCAYMYVCVCVCPSACLCVCACFLVEGCSYSCQSCKELLFRNVF